MWARGGQFLQWVAPKMFMPPGFPGSLLNGLAVVIGGMAISAPASWGLCADGSSGRKLAQPSCQGHSHSMSQGSGLNSVEPLTPLLITFTTGNIITAVHLTSYTNDCAVVEPQCEGHEWLTLPACARRCCSGAAGLIAAVWTSTLDHQSERTLFVVSVSRLWACHPPIMIPHPCNFAISCEPASGLGGRPGV